MVLRCHKAKPFAQVDGVACSFPHQTRLPAEVRAIARCLRFDFRGATHANTMNASTARHERSRRLDRPPETLIMLVLGTAVIAPSTRNSAVTLDRSLYGYV